MGIEVQDRHEDEGRGPRLKAKSCDELYQLCAGCDERAVRWVGHAYAYIQREPTMFCMWSDAHANPKC